MMTVLIGYDGSDHAARAIDVAHRLFPGHKAVIVTVWEPLLVTMRHHLFADGVPFDVEDADTRAAAEATAIAERGVALASKAGFDATALAEAERTDPAEAILAAAQDVDAEVIVLGPHGLRGLREMLGSVSQRVARESRRPVLIAPHHG